jgi:hypothetical protein
LCIDQVNPHLLNRAGLALRALAHWWKLHPEDLHPTNGQLVDTLRALDQIRVDERTIARGLKDLNKIGLVLLERIENHAVGRRIVGEQPPDRSVTPDRSGAPDLSRLTLNVLPEEEHSKTSNVGQNSSVRGDRTVAPPAEPARRSSFEPTRSEPQPTGLANVLGRLTVAIGNEQKEKLPLTGGSNLRRPPALKLHQVIKRLDQADCSSEDLGVIVARLGGEYGPAYQGFYRKVCTAIRTGREPFGSIISAIEEAERESVKNRGAAFVAACKRTMPSLSGGPDPEPSRQAHPGSGGNSAPDSRQSNKSVG